MEIFARHGINLRYIDNNTISLSVNETTTLADLTHLLHVFDEIQGTGEPLDKVMNLENLDKA